PGNVLRGPASPWGWREAGGRGAGSLHASGAGSARAPLPAPGARPGSAQQGRAPALRRFLCRVLTVTAVPAGASSPEPEEVRRPMDPREPPAVPAGLESPRCCPGASGGRALTRLLGQPSPRGPPAASPPAQSPCWGLLGPATLEFRGGSDWASCGQGQPLPGRAVGALLPLWRSPPTHGPGLGLRCGALPAWAARCALWSGLPSPSDTGRGAAAAPPHGQRLGLGLHPGRPGTPQPPSGSAGWGGASPWAKDEEEGACGPDSGDEAPEADRPATGLGGPLPDPEMPPAAGESHCPAGGRGDGPRLPWPGCQDAEPGSGVPAGSGPGGASRGAGVAVSPTLDLAGSVPEAARASAVLVLGSHCPEALPSPATPRSGHDAGADAVAPVEPAKLGVPAKVNPYSVIDITPLQEEQPPASEPDVQEESVSPPVPSGYSVPVPCGYAVPSGLPALLPAYCSPVPVLSASPDEEGSAACPALHRPAGPRRDAGAGLGAAPSPLEDSALARWVADPANTAWMDGPEEAVYDDVPRENSESEPDEMIYDDVENGDEGGNSSQECGWSSSEFESYEEQSDPECRGGAPRSFLRSSHRKHLARDLARLKERYERRMRRLVAGAVGAVELQQLKHKHDLKVDPEPAALRRALVEGAGPRPRVQRLVKAAKEGTRDGLQRTRAAVRRGRSFIRTKSFLAADHRPCPEEEPSVFIDVDCRHADAILTPTPEGLSPQQVVRRYILASVVDSEKSYVEALQRILEVPAPPRVTRAFARQYERPLSEMEPRLLSERKLRTVFHRVREVLQCHRLFQMALASRVAEWDSVETIGDVFVASFSKSMVLDAYSEYVNNFGSAVAVLKRTCAAKPAFLEFLKQSQETSPDRTTLYSLMTKPIQRFPQFILLLQDMLKHTPRGHPDRLPLQMALTELGTLAEKLNARKREADQRCEIKHLAEAVNERYLSKLLGSGSRYLVRCDDMVETTYGDRGEVAKTKERRLFMLNDMLLCTTISTRTPHDGSAGVTPSQRYLLKWSVPLGPVDVVEYGGREAEGSRGHPEHPPEILAMCADSKSSSVYMGPGRLHRDLQDLLHDLGVVGQVAQLVGTLRGNYQNLNPSVAQDWTSGLQRLILKKEEDIRAADCRRIQLQLPGKQDRSGRPTFFTAVFSTSTPAAKESWVHDLRMAKLGLEEDNHMGWFCVEDEGNQIRKERHPLLVGRVPVTVAKQQEFKIECAAYNPEPQLSECHSDVGPAAHGFLWIGSCASQMGQIAIVSFQDASPKVIECFNVESRVLCMAYIPPGGPPRAGPEGPSAGAPAVPTICLGTEEGSISVYKSSQGAKKVRLQHFFTPDKASVLSLAGTPQRLYAGLVDGAVAIYAKAEDGSWASEPQKLVRLGVLPVRGLLVAEDTLWAASGGQVSVISTDAHGVQSQLDAHQEEGMVVAHMAVAGVGVWIAFTTGSTLRLFHTETLRHLQDVNIATPVHSLLPGLGAPGQQRLSVTCLLVCHGLLMVGTSLGIVVALPVPRLQGIPKVTGRGLVSYHAHSGPVKFLVLAAAPTTDADRPRDSPAPTEPQDAAQPQGPGGPDAPVWLGGSLGSVADRGDASSCSGSLAPRAEDSGLCDLLRPPQLAPGGGRRARRPRAGSVLVACGGQGHRRVSRRVRPPRPEDLASSLMVWQVPLLPV
ncbi:Rho guanine nucleotide exchange factor 10, partial [Galemys pyrenaicus]